MNLDLPTLTRLGKGTLMLWALVLLLSVFAPPSSAATRATRVVVLEHSGAGTAPEAAVERLGGRVERQIPLVRGFVARLPWRGVAPLRRSAGVRSVNRDRRFALRSTETPAVANTTLDAVRETVGADAVARGARVDVAMVDSGVSPTGALAGRVVNGPDLSADESIDELRSLEAFGHGTHLAGVIAGVAPDARAINVKVADRDGATTLARLLTGIDWVVRHGNRDGLDVRVLNLAFGAEPDGSYRDDPLAYAVERAWDRGIVVVAAAGNGGATTPGLDSPAHDPYVIAAGAADPNGTVGASDDTVAPFSSRGSEARGADVVAPAVGIVSTRVAGGFLDESFPGARVGEDGFRGSGTSQAAAVVSAAAALLLSGREDLTPDQVKALLRGSATLLPGSDSATQGAGQIDVSAAAVTAATKARQRFANARPGGWTRRAIGNAFAVGSRWSGSRWSGSRWSGSRWSGSRWSGSRWSGETWDAPPITP